ncbi:DUF305 domain-containing protein [uncultured Brevundimonas sp.]|uniref:CopM family metallochaperone n=1 Tax=uncultured Brevundimonas sp. TaxID=213418 RepID=UPI0025CB9635|nr:DUF305 domain-containing protein [uncultured Brevundimonas sp.]
MTQAYPSQWIRTGALALSSALAGAAVMAFAQTPTSDFDQAMTEAMERMHRDMAVAPTGDPDADFAAMMIPHHQGAIDMARAELLYGQDETMKRLAQGIIVEQTQEIALMRDYLTRHSDAPTPTGGATSTHHGHGS